ncbi:hypothetical protein [Rhodococcus sp. JG-3]|uniref:hypothetical protein n=1 Tax=Rhodococcus sp. JG-3 TaxID=1305835 RepID=UPI000410D4BA|nr:hypothetical protein [Rhodococcus sp. JG-3]
MTIIATAPTSAEVHARLEPDGMELTVLAEVVRGPFKAAIKRHDARDGDEPYSDAPQIEIDCSEQDGGECFCDLTILPHYVDDFLHVAIEIWADFKVISGGIEIERDGGAFVGEWFVSAGTKGTPSRYIGEEKREVFASTTWQENDCGQRTQPYVAITAGPCVGFLPSEAMTFALECVEESARAKAIEALGVTAA